VPLFEEWPFAVVPTERRGAVWAGRPATQSSLEAFLSRWRRRPASEITVMWADFGQGKTHSLYYLAQQLSHSEDVTHYVQLPPLTTGSPFVALYRQLLRDFPLESLGHKVFEYFRNSPMDLFRIGTPSIRPILQLLWIVATNSPGKETALRWLRGDKVPPRDLPNLSIAGKSLSIGPAPTTAQDCQNTLDALISVVTDFPKPSSRNFILLIDEFQRIGELPPRKRIEVCSALHLLFNRHPDNLRLVLAFAGGLPEIVDAVLTPDLLNRVNGRLDLPPLSLHEGSDYIESLLAQYGAPDLNAVYSPDALTKILRSAAIDHELSPRRINVAFDLVTNAVLDRRTAAGDPDDAPLSGIEVDRALAGSREALSVQLGTTG
jgi:hypothetical protein